MKIALLGASGLLGSAMLEVLGPKHTLVPFSRAECDICNVESIKGAFRYSTPEVIINAAAFTDVDGAESNPQSALSTNDIGVKNLADYCACAGALLVHFSTDYVFDGSREEGYLEDDQTNPLNVYGVSKARGEAHVLSLKRFFLIRSSWLFGPGGRNFVDTMLRQAHEQPEELAVVSDQRGCPTYTLDLAEAVARLLNSDSYGIYHMTNGGSASWFEFAVEIFRQLGIPQKIRPISSRELMRPARRPSYSILRSTRAHKLRHWRTALESYLSQKQLML